jgi:multiple sugar transport system substrate-binding protein
VEPEVGVSQNNLSGSARVDVGPTSIPTEPNSATTMPKVSFLKKFGPVIGIVGLVLIVAMVGVFLLTKNKGGATTSKVTLNYWGLWEDSNLLESLISDYEAKNPGVTINYKRNQITDYRTRLQGRLSKNSPNEEIPDIFRVHSSWIPMFTGEIEPVPVDTATKLNMDKDFYEVYKNDLKISGRYQAIPLMFDSLGLYYNKDIIDTAGVTPPRSWWDLQETAKQLTVRDQNGSIKVAGLAAGMVENVDHWSDILNLIIKQNNGDILISNSPENDNNIKDALVYYVNFKTLHKVWDDSLPPSTEMFANGKLAFYFAPSWRAFNIEDMNPKLKYEIISVPQLPTLKDVPKDQAYAPANLTNIHLATYWVEAVNSKSSPAKQKEAWKFLEYLASKEGLEKLFQVQSQSRSFGEIYPRKSMADELSTNAKIKPFLTVADFAESGYLSSRTFDDGLNDQMSKYFADAVNTIATSGETDKSMDTLRSGINQLTTKYKLQKQP